MKKEPVRDETPSATEAPVNSPQSPPSAPPPPATEVKPLPKNEAKFKQGRDTLDLSNRTPKSKSKRHSADLKESEKLKKSASVSTLTFDSKSPTSSENEFSVSNKSELTARSAVLTGGRNELGFIYSGASNDSILKFLISNENKVTEQQAKLNKKLAGSIFEMSYLVDKTNQITIDISLKTKNEISNYRFQTAFKENSLMTMSHSNLFVTAQCVDSYKYSDNCSNLLIKIETEGAQSQAILRQSSADLKLWFYDVNDVEYNELFQFLKNSFTNSIKDNESKEKMNHKKVKEIYFNSFEILNGRSGFSAIIMGQDKEMISLKSELMLKQDLTAAQNNVEKNLDESDLNVFLSTQGSHGDTSFMDLFKSATVIENNSMGQVTIEIKTEAKRSKIANKIVIRFSRISIPTSME